MVQRCFEKFSDSFYRRKIHQERITNGFDNRAVMLSHRLLNNLVMHLQQS